MQEKIKIQEALRLKQEEFIKNQILIFAKNKKTVTRRTIFLIISIFIFLIGLILFIGFNNKYFGVSLTFIGAMIVIISSILVVISTIKITFFLKKLQSAIQQRNNQDKFEFNIDENTVVIKLK